MRLRWWIPLPGPIVLVPSRRPHTRRTCSPGRTWAPSERVEPDGSAGMALIKLIAFLLLIWLVVTTCTAVLG